MQDESSGYDVVVIGAGLAGSVLADRLSAGGASVLVIEAGAETPPPVLGGGLLSKIRTRLRQGPLGRPGPNRWPSLIHWEGRDLPAMMGFGPGGSSTLYGAALARFRRRDFAVDDTGPCGSEAAGYLPNDWPLDFDAFRDWYARAEALMRVSGVPDPLDVDDDARLAPPPAISPRDRAFVDALKSNGTHPYPIHTGMDRLPGCNECQGFRCERGCKADGWSRALAPAVAAGRVTLRHNLAVRDIQRAGNGFRIVTAALDPARPGQALEQAGAGAGEDIRAGQVVLAAGALSTPLILARAGLWDGSPPDLLGRGLMFHLSEFFAVIGETGLRAEGPRKVIALRDYYDIDGVPHGEIQSVGASPNAGMIAQYLKAEAARLGLGRLGLALEGLRIPAAMAAGYFEEAGLFSTIVEDYPRHENRITDGAPDAPLGQVRIAYKVPKEAAARAARLRQLSKAAFAPNRVVFLSRPSTPNWGHPMGTARMGQAPEASVTDTEGRVWGQPGLRIADASLFPSAGGTNPGLTVVANALRIAEGMLKAG